MTFLNLLPIAHQRRSVIRSHLRFWTLIGSLLAISGAATFWHQHEKLERLEVSLDSLNQRYAPVKRLATDLKTLQLEMAAIDHRKSLAGQLSQRHPALTIVGIVSQSAAECGGDVSVSRLIYALESSGNRRPATSPTASSEIRLEGLAVNNLSIARLATALRKTGLFRQVRLDTTQEEIVADTTARRYTMVCTF